MHGGSQRSLTGRVSIAYHGLKPFLQGFFRHAELFRRVLYGKQAGFNQFYAHIDASSPIDILIVEVPCQILVHEGLFKSFCLYHIRNPPCQIRFRSIVPHEGEEIPYAGVLLNLVSSRVEDNVVGLALHTFAFANVTTSCYARVANPSATREFPQCGNS